VACHDPQRETEHARSLYDAKCNACHSAGVEMPAGDSTRHAKICRVAAKDCIT
jgi:cytochrome c5